MVNKQDILKKVVELLKSRFEISFEDDLNYDTNLFESGYIDSIDSLVVISFIEKNFNISITPDDLIETPMRSVNEMVDFVSRMKGM